MKASRIGEVQKAVDQGMTHETKLGGLHFSYVHVWSLRNLRNQQFLDSLTSQASVDALIDLLAPLSVFEAFLQISSFDALA